MDASPVTSRASAFDARRVLAQAPAGGPCTYTRDSVATAGWTSVLYRLGHRNDPSGRADMPDVPYPRLMLSTRGAVTVRRRDDGGRDPLLLAAGRTWLVPPGVPLRYEWTGAGRSRRELAMLVLPRADLDDAAGALAEQQGRAARWTEASLVDDPVVRAVMTGMLDAMVTGQDDLYAQTASAFLLHHLLVTHGAGVRGPLRTGHEDARVRQAIAYLHDHLHLPVTLADVAAHVGLSSYHFLRVFRAATGRPPGRFLAELRIDAARRLLADPDLSVTDVARRCGYASSSHFATAFRRATGTSPRDHRRARR